MRHSWNRSSLLHSALLMLGISVQSAFAVEISRSVYLPEIEGLVMDPPGIPSEVSRHNDRTYTFEMTEERVSKLLEQLQMPPLSGSETTNSLIPQCRETETLRTAEYQLVLSDADWLAQQSRWCRLTRKVFGACKPEKFSDLLPAQSLRMESSDSIADLNSSVTVAPAPGCISEPSTQTDKRMDALKACAVSSDVRPCMHAFEHAVPQGQRGANWSVKLLFSSPRVMKEVLPPLIQSKIKETGLTSLTLDSIQMTRGKGGTSWKGKLSLMELLAILDSPRERVSVLGVYTVRVNGIDEGKIEAKSELPVTTHSVRVNNLPRTVVLERGEILSLEEWSSEEEQQAIAGYILDWCDTHARRSDFGSWVCYHLPRNRSAFTRSIQMRVRFVDQDGIERLLTWERRAPVADCKASESQGFTCQVPNDWSQWVADPSRSFKQIFDDPTYDERTRVEFQGILGFIPRASGAPPLGGFVTPQSRKFLIQTLSGLGD